MEDDDQSLWFYTACGLVRVARSEVDAWAAAVEKDKHTKLGVQVTVFDSSDGVRSNLVFHGFKPRVAKTADGRLWFLPQDGVSVIDPRRLPFNQLPPPVYIEQVTAERQDLRRRARLAPAAAGARPANRLHRAQLCRRGEGPLPLQAGRLRQRAGGRPAIAGRRSIRILLRSHYRFRVLACNNSGVWNEEGALLDFSVDPAFYQTTWFRVACVALFLALLWAAYQLRVRQLAHQFNRTLEARVSERTRIARELHDTLLQSFQGLLLRFQSASKILPARPVEAKQRLDSALDQAAEAIAEGRDAVQGLRSSAFETNDLAKGITAIAEELTERYISPRFSRH